MNIKDAIILLIVVVIGVTIANLICLKIAASQVQSSLSASSPLSLLGSLFGNKPATPATPAAS